MWKVRIYKGFGVETETVIPDSLAQAIFTNNNLGCSKDYPNTKIFFDNKRTLVFDRVLADKEDMKNE